jgi:5-dehydro-2-deoxygluconokinase
VNVGADAFEVITTGRIGVDLYPLEVERKLEDVETFSKSLGGSPSNVAVAAARLGCRTATITMVGDDPFGVYLKHELRRYDVDDRWVGVVAGVATPLAFCEVFPPDHFPLLFYRERLAPDLHLRREDLDLEEIAACGILWTTGSALSVEPSRAAVLAALDARGGGAGRETIHDLDYRPAFWHSRASARRWAREAVRRSTVAVGNQDEVELATGVRDPEAAATALIELGARLAIVKCGPDGVYALERGGQALRIAPLVVDVVNGLGAGDAFGGALCAGIVHGWGLERTLRAANAAGALVATRLACAPAMPERKELEDLVGPLGAA